MNLLQPTSPPGACPAPDVDSTPAKSAISLRARLAAKSGVLRLAGVHDVMGAWLAERAGFDGLWASSLEITTAAGRLDDGWEAAEMVQQMAAGIASASGLPLVADCQVDCRNPAGVEMRVAFLADAGIAGLCMQDSLFPCPNSLLPGEHPLAPKHEFAAAVAVARATAPESMAVIARVQSLVAGSGQADALDRARTYVAAGADAIVIHSREGDPTQILDFIAAWDGCAPLVLIPSTYPALTFVKASRTGGVGMMIYANHGLRASLAAMSRVFGEILGNGGSGPSEEWIATLDEVFVLQHDSRTRRP